MKYINLTPRWTELVRTWQVIVADATKIRKSDQMTRFWEHFEKASEAADRYNDLVAYLKSPAMGWTKEDFEGALTHGRAIQELDRNTIKESAE